MKKSFYPLLVLALAYLVMLTTSDEVVRGVAAFLALAITVVVVVLSKIARSKAEDEATTQRIRSESLRVETDALHDQLLHRGPYVLPPAPIQVVDFLFTDCELVAVFYRRLTATHSDPFGDETCTIELGDDPGESPTPSTAVVNRWLAEGSRIRAGQAYALPDGRFAQINSPPQDNRGAAMKAGVYQTPSGLLIYVAKDRTVTAGPYYMQAVSHRAKDNTVTVGDVRCTHYRDVPNGCTDHKAFLESLYKEQQDALDKQRAFYADLLGRMDFDSEPRVDGCPPSLAAPYGRDPQRVLLCTPHDQPGKTHALLGDQVRALIDIEVLGPTTDGNYVVHDPVKFREFMKANYPELTRFWQGIEVDAEVGHIFPGPKLHLAAPPAPTQSRVARDDGWLASRHPRPVGRQSARKHRKAGHRVWWDAVRGTRVWAPV